MENPPTEEAPPPTTKRNLDDVGWDYGCIIDAKYPDKLKCLLCRKTVSGGVTRMKEHIDQVKGNVSRCPRASKEDQAKCMKGIMETKTKKINKRKSEEALRAEVNISKDHIIDELQRELGSMRDPHFQGPIDKFTKSINPEASAAGQNGNRASMMLFQRKKHMLFISTVRGIYNSNIAFNAIDNDDFRLFCEALGQFGPGWQPPSQYQLRKPLLNEERKKTKEKLKCLVIL